MVHDAAIKDSFSKFESFCVHVFVASCHVLSMGVGKLNIGLSCILIKLLRCCYAFGAVTVGWVT